jgi:hypothetical protein
VGKKRSEAVRERVFRQKTVLGNSPFYFLLFNALLLRIFAASIR